MVDKTSRLENQILHFSKLEKWNRVEAHWPEVLQDPPADPKFYATLAKRMVKAQKISDLKTWFSQLAEQCLLADQYRILIQAARGVLSAFPEFDELRAPLLTALRGQYTQNPKMEEFLEECGLTRETALAKPLNRFLQFIQCGEGEVFQHPVWGVGQVAEMNPRDGRVVIDFASQGRRSLSFEGVRDFLKKLPRSHLFAQRLLNPRGLAKRAEADPVEFLKYCLKSLGGAVMQSDLKEHLLQGVFDARKWSSWWGRSRQKFRLDPYVGFSGSAGNARLELRAEPRSFAEEIFTAFQQSETFAQRHGLVADLLKHRDAEPMPPETAARISGMLKDWRAGCPPENRAQRIEYLFLTADFARGLGAAQGQSVEANAREKEAFSLLDAEPNPGEVLSAMSVLDYQVRAATRLRDASAEHWPERAQDLFLSSPMRLAQWVLRDLVERGNVEAAGHVAEQLIHRPHLNPDLFLWLVRSVRGGKWAELLLDMPSRTLFSVVMDLIDDCQRSIDRETPDASSLRGLQARLANLLMENHHAIIADVFQTVETAEAREKYRVLMDHPGLTPSFKVSLDHAVRSLREDLDETKESEGAQPREHFVTALSFEARQKEYLRIKNVDIPAMSKAIGDAARLGDLSENAEYHAAKERQKILFRRLEQLQDLLQRARILEASHVSTDSIGVGTEFEVKNLDTGKVEQYRLLGLWDAEPERNTLSYLTPFGKQFLNRKVGETLIITRPGGGTTQYQVLAIGNALARAHAGQAEAAP